MASDQAKPQRASEASWGPLLSTHVLRGVYLSMTHKWRPPCSLQRKWIIRAGLAHVGEIGDRGEGLLASPLSAWVTALVLSNPAFAKPLSKTPALLFAVLTGPVKPLAGSALVRAISFECFSAETIRRNVIAWAPLGGQLQERVGSCEGARDGFHISHSVSPSVRQSVLGLFSFTEAEFCMEP